MHWAQGQRLEDQHVEGALQKIGFLFLHAFSPIDVLYISRRRVKLFVQNVNKKGGADGAPVRGAGSDLNLGERPLYRSSGRSPLPVPAPGRAITTERHKN